MNYTITQNQFNQSLNICIHIDFADTLNITFDDFEQKLIDECNESKSVADILLMYEMIARKIQANLTAHAHEQGNKVPNMEYKVSKDEL